MIENKDIPRGYIDWMDETIAAIHDFTRPALPMMREVAIAAYRHLKAQPSPVLRWVKLNERLPKLNAKVVFRWIDNRGAFTDTLLGRKDYNGNIGLYDRLEWLEEEEPDPTHTA